MTPLPGLGVADGVGLRLEVALGIAVLVGFAAAFEVGPAAIDGDGGAVGTVGCDAHPTTSAPITMATVQRAINEARELETTTEVAADRDSAELALVDSSMPLTV